MCIIWVNLSTLNVLAEKNSKKRCKKVAKIFGGKEKVRIFAARLRNNGKFYDNTERDNEVKIEIKKSL